MKKKYYIAYGSNLSVEQMRHRTPDARIVGTAILFGWQLLFKVHATIEPNPKKNTPVLVWEISERDEKNLDLYEGFPGYYYKKELKIEVHRMEGTEPEPLTAMVYIMADGRKLAEPHPSYYKVLEDGYKAFHFPMHILEQALADSIGREEAIARLGECSLTKPVHRKEKIKVICNGEIAEWENRKDADMYYRKLMEESEGDERARYAIIRVKLLHGWNVCSDWNGIDVQELLELEKGEQG